MITHVLELKLIPRIVWDIIHLYSFNNFLGLYVFYYDKNTKPSLLNMGKSFPRYLESFTDLHMKKK